MAKDDRIIQIEPELFEGTAWYYARYRPAYPREAIDILTARFNLNQATAVLDLGCGTGQIAIPLAARGIPVYAVDPDVEMLAEGLRAEQRAGIYGITWLGGDDDCLNRLPLAPLTLCTMGESYHWMNRDEVLSEGAYRRHGSIDCVAVVRVQRTFIPHQCRERHSL